MAIRREEQGSATKLVGFHRRRLLPGEQPPQTAYA